MNQELFALILACLEPKTLAYLVRDLQDLRADWQYYPEEAPNESVREELEQLIKLLMTQGVELTAAGEAVFLQLIEQARAEQQAEDWAHQRDQQERKNWLQDYE